MTKEIIYASPLGGTQIFEGEPVETLEPQAAVDMAQPGNTVQLLPGSYPDPIQINRGGRPDAVFTLRGPNSLDAYLDGGKDRTSAVGDIAHSDSDFAFITITKASHIRLESLSFKNCWPTGIFLHGASHISVLRCHGVGAKHLIYAKEHQRFLRKPSPSAFITLDNITWIQDPDKEMWTGSLTWNDVKGTTDTDGTFFNGALFGSFEISGPVCIVNCEVSHAFNGVRMDANTHSLTANRNRNILIRDNTFSFIRDNAIEPEKSAQNLWVVNNSFYNVHATFSLDRVAGQFWYFINNTVLNVELPSTESDLNRGGKIYKFHQGNPFPTQHFYSLHNSVSTRTSYAKKGKTNAWTHANNAISICVSDTDPHCDPNRKMFKDDEHEFEWRDSYRWINDICDHADFPDHIDFGSASILGAKNVVKKTFDSPGFSGGTWNRALVLQERSLGHNSSAAVSVTLIDGTKWQLPAGQDVGALSIGLLGLPDFITPKKFGY